MRGNLADLAATGLASEPTIRKWIAAEPDQPWIIKRGSNGDAYEIDIEAAVDAWKAKEAAATEVARARAAELRQLGLDLGLNGSPDDGAALSIAERKQLLEEELVAIRIAEKRRELVPRASVEAAFGDVLIRDRQRRSTFAARLAKKVDLSRDLLTAIDRMMTADQADFARELKEWDRDIGDSDAGAAGPADDPAAALVDSAV